MNLKWTCILSALLLIGLFFLAASEASNEPSAKQRSFGLNKAGNLHSEVIGLWLMGQSLGTGSESLPLVSTEDAGFGSYMFRMGVRTWRSEDGGKPKERPESMFDFVPLMAQERGAEGETIANGMADHLKAMIVRKGSAAGVSSRGVTPHFLVACAAQGGRYIDELSSVDEATDPRAGARKSVGGYYRTSLDDARRAVKQSRTMGLDFRIGALIWMQGEANNMASGIKPNRWDVAIPREAGLEWYRERLMAYRKQWSDDLRTITGQDGEIPMFTYQTLAVSGEAQLLAADRDPYIYMVGPHYMVPSAVNSHYRQKHGVPVHLTADGERWYGEQVGKVIYRVLAKGENWQPFRPQKAWMDDAHKNIFVEFVVPRPPLVLDTNFLPRQQSQAGNGFGTLCGFSIVDASGRQCAISSVDIQSSTIMRIQLASELSKGSGCTVNYGYPYCGNLGLVKEIRSSLEMDKQDTSELVIDGDCIDLCKAILEEGAFFADNGKPGPEHARTLVRWVQAKGKATVLRFENRDLQGSQFKAGQSVTAFRPFSYGNLRDSDTEPSINHFANGTYGKRTGRSYPLWNWCVVFRGFPVKCE